MLTAYATTGTCGSRAAEGSDTMTFPALSRSGRRCLLAAFVGDLGWWWWGAGAPGVAGGVGRSFTVFHGATEGRLASQK